MQNQPINLKEKLHKISQFWSPKIVAQMNDYDFKLVKFQGEFVWHDHKDTDEAFLVIAGEMTIHFHERDVRLSIGELYVIPRGVEHKTSAAGECHALIIEPRGTVNTGDVRDSKTARQEWI